MNVLVIGANGQIGKHLVRMLQDSTEHTVTAMVRKEEQAAELKEKGIKTVLADLEGTVDELQQAMAGCDAIVFTAGSGGQTGPDKTLLIDLDGAVKTMEAAEAAGISRYVMVSAFHADQRELWHDAIKPYYVAKHYADKELMASNLNFTIVRPGGLINDPSTGKIVTGERLGRGTIPREDVAEIIKASLTEKQTFKKAFDVISGEQSIEEALKNL